MATMRRMEPEDAAAVVALAGVYPPAMREGRQQLERKLARLADDDNLLAWVLEEGGACVGYLVAWEQPSLLDVAEPDAVVFVDDVQVLPACTYGLYALLEALYEAVDGRTVEGVCRRHASRVFLDHEDTLGRLGYGLAATYAWFDPVFGEELLWMRWEPSDDAAHDYAPLAVA